MRARRRSSLPAALAVAAAIAAAAPTAAVAASPVRVSAKPVAAPLSARPAATTIAVRNVSRRRLAGLTLSVSAAKGVKVALAGAKRGARSRRLKPLKPGRTARVRVTLRASGKGAKRGRLAVRVTRRGKTIGRGRLAFGAGRPSKPRRPSKPGEPSQPGAPKDPNSLAGRYFWGATYVLGMQTHSLYFTGPDLVYTDETGDAWPSCAAPSDVCKPYRYDGASGQLTIDGKPATLAGRKLTFDDDDYREFGFPPAGARWDTVVTYSSQSGVCPLYCSFYTENLTFRPDGTFMRDAVASGSGPVVDWASVPPDSKGTYEVRADHTLRLAYEDGRERIETVALYLNDDGTLQAPGEGIVLGGDGYFDIRD